MVGAAFGRGSLAALSVLLACGGNGSKTTTVDVDPETIQLSAAKPVELVFWYQHSREREDALQQLIAEFNQTNGVGITVKGEYSATTVISTTR